MLRHLRRLTVASIAALLVVAVAPAQGADPITGTGTGGTRIDLASLELTAVPAVGDVGANLGTLLTEATNVDGAAATASLTGLAAAGQEAEGFSASSEDGAGEGSRSVAASQGPIAASVELARYAVTAGTDTALAQLGALGGSVSVADVLSVGIDGQELVTTATPTASTSAVNVGVSGLGLDLGDLLGDDLLAALPLSLVLDLLGELGVPLPAELADVPAAVDELVATLDEAAVVAADLDDAREELAAVIDSDPAVAAALQAVEDAEAEVAALEAEIADKESELAALDPVIDALLIDALEDEIAALEAELAQAEQDLADARDDLDAALDDATADLVALIEELEATLQGLLDTLDGLLGDLPDLQALLDELLGLLAGTSLFDLGEVTVALSTVADGVKGTASATCQVGAGSVLGQDVPAATCDEVGALVATVGGAVTGALDALPVAGELPTVAVTGPTTSTSASDAPDENRTTTATATLSALGVEIPSVSLTDTVDSLVADLEAALGDLLATDAVGDLLGVAGSVDGGVTPAQVDLPDGLADELASLEATLGDLPVGDALGGLRTTGLTSAVGTVTVSSTFTADEPTTVGGPTDDSSTADGTPGTALPRTGADDGVRFAAAFAAVALAGALMLMRRRLVAVPAGR